MPRTLIQLEHYNGGREGMGRRLIGWNDGEVVSGLKRRRDLHLAACTEGVVGRSCLTTLSASAASPRSRQTVNLSIVVPACRRKRGVGTPERALVDASSTFPNAFGEGKGQCWRRAYHRVFERNDRKSIRLIHVPQSASSPSWRPPSRSKWSSSLSSAPKGGYSGKGPQFSRAMSSSSWQRPRTSWTGHGA